MAADIRHAIHPQQPCPWLFCMRTNLEDWENCSKFPYFEVAEYRREWRCQTTRGTFLDNEEHRKSRNMAILEALNPPSTTHFG